MGSRALVIQPSFSWSFQASSDFLEGLLTLCWGSLCWADEEVINSAGMVLGALVVAVESVLSGGPIPQGLQANVVAHLLVLGVHGAVGLHGRSVFRVQGGIPIPSYYHGLS